MGTRTLRLFLSVLLLAALGSAGELSSDLRAKLEASIDRGIDYLREHQKEDGSWENDAGITGLAATAILKKPGAEGKPVEPYVRKALDYLASLAKDDGGIYIRDTPNYYTAVGMVALNASGDPKYDPLLEKSRAFLVGFQVDEEEGYSEDDKFYGGIGYGSDLRPDLANLEFALAALKDSAVPEDHPVWERAIKFIQRTQNRSESNDQEWAGNDGGFVYYPGFSYGGDAKGTQSYGSMTYAGLLSYSYANVKKEDARVRAALDWIREHYTVDENPGMRMTTLYYYYMVFAKALQAHGEDVIVDKNGVGHNWREDLGRKLLELQYPEGYWVNEDPAWWQDNKVLVTSFTLLALDYVLLD